MAEEQRSGTITPDTRVAELLKNFPELEELLVTLSPDFAKLRNPILRRTVAKVTTLRQAAKIGKLSVGELINTLRRAAGLPDMNSESDSNSQPESRPEWVTGRDLAQSFDAGPLIESGGNPLATVLAHVKLLEAGKRYELLTPFLPAPLIDILRGKGFLTWSEQGPAGIYHTHVTRQ